MRAVRILVALLSLGAAVLAVALTLPSCSNQGEGDRCNVLGDNNGNDECQDGLVCTRAADLGAPTDLCCPPDRRNATTAVCRIAQNPLMGDAAPPPPPPPVCVDDAEVDGCVDAAPDASMGADSSEDSPAIMEAAADSAADSTLDSAPDGAADGPTE